MERVLRKLVLLHKGQIELPFHLVFALVAGSIILLIFVVFAFKGFTISKAEHAIDVANTLHLLLTSTEISSKTFLPIEDLPKVKLEFTCEDFSVDGQAKSYRNKIVFAPSSLKTTRLFFWSFDWNVPFYVTNMIAITSPSVLYVFVGGPGDELMKFLQGTIPRNITTLFTPTVQNFQPTGHEQTRFIFVNNDQTIPASFAGRKVNGLRIKGTVDNPDVTFLSERGQPIQPFPLLGPALLLGAIFSDNIETYSCNVDKAFTRLQYLARIYDAKQTYLAQHVTGRSCSYTAPLSSLFSSTKQNALKSTVDTIKQTNKMLQQQSCPLIY